MDQRLSRSACSSPGAICLQQRFAIAMRLDNREPGVRNPRLKAEVG
ncbi:hypothetical protein [Anabaena sp. CS-542/02]|nr:hypothetical protein [Anabaena sp. CS-542/02]